MSEPSRSGMILHAAVIGSTSESTNYRRVKRRLNATVGWFQKSPTPNQPPFGWWENPRLLKRMPKQETGNLISWEPWDERYVYIICCRGNFDEINVVKHTLLVRVCVYLYIYFRHVSLLEGIYTDMFKWDFFQLTVS